jgi:hypothetical protein
MRSSLDDMSITFFLTHLEIFSVLDKGSRILEVVVVRRLLTWDLGIWSGEGMGKGWERGGQFTSNLRPRWTDPVTEGGFPSK